jgi:hypothetical protein
MLTLDTVVGEIRARAHTRVIGTAKRSRTRTSTQLSRAFTNDANGVGPSDSIATRGGFNRRSFLRSLP